MNCLIPISLLFAAGLVSYSQPVPNRLRTNYVRLGSNSVVFEAHIESSPSLEGPWKLESTMSFSDYTTNGSPRYLRARLAPAYVTLLTTNDRPVSLPFTNTPPPIPK